MYIYLFIDKHMACATHDDDDDGSQSDSFLRFHSYKVRSIAVTQRNGIEKIFIQTFNNHHS